MELLQISECGLGKEPGTAQECSGYLPQTATILESGRKLEVWERLITSHEEAALFFIYSGSSLTGEAGGEMDGAL